MEAVPTLSQRSAMEVTERIVSCISVLGIFFILGTYIFSAQFQRPINRLVFFAAFGNLGMSIASLIGERGPAAGANSTICQLQGFMVQMFVPKPTQEIIHTHRTRFLGVDAYWSLCMAINVYLIFFGRFTTARLRCMDIGYIIGCYGLAVVPSLAFLLADSPRGAIYGDAVLWCWVQDNWSVLRIGLVYAISWIAIALALSVYGLAAISIYQRRDQLQPGFMNPLNDRPLKSVITVDNTVTVVSAEEARGPRSPTSPALSIDAGTRTVGIPAIESSGSYQVAITATPASTTPRLRSTASVRKLTRTAAERDVNTEALLYARAAFFYFTALLVIWVPASANRVWAFAHPGQYNFPLNCMSCLLLSAQGTLNGIVYITTSSDPVKKLFSKLSLRPATRQQDPALGEQAIAFTTPKWEDRAVDSFSTSEHERQRVATAASWI